MNIIGPSVEILSPVNAEEAMTLIECCGRTCYKSENLITKESAKSFFNLMLRNGHDSVIEHYNMTVRFICDRGVTHELVRHRLASYSQESTRYCNYTNEKFGRGLTFILPSWIKDMSGMTQQEKTRTHVWTEAMMAAESAYLKMINQGATPQEARAVLPNSLKTEIVMTANLREWRHVLLLRTSEKSHPDMRQVMGLLVTQLRKIFPELLQGIVE